MSFILIIERLDYKCSYHDDTGDETFCNTMYTFCSIIQCSFKKIVAFSSKNNLYYSDDCMEHIKSFLFFMLSNYLTFLLKKIYDISIFVTLNYIFNQLQLQNLDIFNFTTYTYYLRSQSWYNYIKL